MWNIIQNEAPVDGGGDEKYLLLPWLFPPNELYPTLGEHLLITLYSTCTGAEINDKSHVF